MKRSTKRLPKRSKPPAPTRRPRKAAVVTRPPTAKERYAKGARNACDICGAKIGTKLRGNKKVEIWTFTVKGANGRLFNRCARCLKKPVKVR